MKKGTFLLLFGLTAHAQAVGFDHSAFDRVLSRYVDHKGRVDYAGLKANPHDLDTYLAALAKESPDANPALFPSWDDELAYWINAYNACVLKGALRYYPIKSVRQARAAYGFFLRDRYVLGGQLITLHVLENKIIRKRYKDPRVHFALNCASIGCPRLPQKAFEGKTLQTTLDQAAHEFMTHPEKVRIRDRRLELSSIFDWYKKDFLEYLRMEKDIGKPTLADYVRLYAPPELAGALDGKKIAFIGYDWGLNDQK